MSEVKVELPSTAHGARFRVPVRALLLATGVVLSTATQWRIGGGPVGVGELLLAAWLAMSFVRVLSRGRIALPPVAKLVLGFWGVSLTLLLAGALVALGLGVWSSSGGFHDLLALTFAALLSIFLVVGPNAGREIERASRYLVFFAVGAMTLLYLSSLGLFSIPSTTPLYGEARFTGWAKNPNQMALLSVVVPFIAIRLRQRVSGRLQRFLCLVAVGLSVLVGVQTGSDALFLSWFFGGSFLLVLIAVRWAITSEKRFWSGYVTYVLFPFVTIVFLVVLAAPLLRLLSDAALAIHEGQNAQGSARLTLWRHGLGAMSVSPLVGLGPGAYSGMTGPFHGSEAHNTFIDWGMSTGILGILAYGLTVARVLMWAWKRKDLASFVGLTSLVVFSLFHFVLRHPIFWFYLILAAGREPSPRVDCGRLPVGRGSSGVPRGSEPQEIPALR